MENTIKEKLNTLKKERSKYESKRGKITKKKNEKIDKIEKQFRKDIKELTDNISLVNKNIKDIEDDIRKYSTFDISSIGKVLEMLISIMEVEKYEVKQIENTGSEYETTPFGVEEFSVDK